MNYGKLFYKAKKEQIKKEKLINKINKKNPYNWNNNYLFTKNIQELKIILKVKNY